MLNVMYEVPGRANIESVTINRAVVEGNKPPILRRKRADAA
jgi:ATP-dependent Clp protease ATP-binding subunit ClpX